MASKRRPIIAPSCVVFDVTLFDENNRPLHFRPQIDARGLSFLPVESDLVVGPVSFPDLFAFACQKVAKP